MRKYLLSGSYTKKYIPSDVAEYLKKDIKDSDILVFIPTNFDEHESNDKHCLEYRSLCFETKNIDSDNFQGVVVVKNTDIKIPYTRTIEHKHFDNANTQNTIVSYEYPEN